MDTTRECHRIVMFKGPNVVNGPGITDVVPVGRYMLDADKKYVNKWWSDDEKRIVSLPTVEELKQNPINLNEGFDSEKWIKNAVTDDVLKSDLKIFQALLEWIYIKAFDLVANNIKVVANGPTLYDLLQAPFGRKNPDSLVDTDFMIYLSKYNGVLYMFRFYGPQLEKDESFRLVKYRGKKFRSTMTKNVSGDLEVNNNESAKVKRRVVNKASFRGLNLLYTSKVSAIDSKGRCVALHVMPEDNVAKFSFYRKLLRHWSIATFTPAPKMLIGLRQRHENENDPNSEVLVTDVKKIATATIPSQVAESTLEGRRIMWEPRICFKNLESVIDTLMAITEDDPKAVYRLENGHPNQHGYIDHLILRKMDLESNIEVIPSWYID